MKFDLARMRHACKVAAQTLRAVEVFVKPGVTTDDINRFVHNDTLKRGGIPAPLNYRGFPKSCCTSVNDVVCHGIPGSYVLKQGDIINVDVTTIVDGHFGDCSKTFAVGTISAEAIRLIEATSASLHHAIAAIEPGLELSTVGRVVQEYAHAHGFSVVREFGGHSIGTIFHGDLHVSHWTDGSSSPRIERGMIFTVEPMLSIGDRSVRLDMDGWTVRTADGSFSAQEEHTLLVTDTRAEILTLP